MALASARFRGDPTLERIHDGDTTAYLRFGAQGDHVRAVQYALIDLGYAIPSGATGNFLNETSAAVVQYKTDHNLVPNDPVVGVLTISALDDEWALPFADRDEWLSWQVRPIPEFNFTRQDALDRRSSGRQFTFNANASWLPQPFQDALITGFNALLDPTGSPLGQFTPSATWGIGPLDTFHCHVVVDVVGAAPSWSLVRTKESAVSTRGTSMRSQADQSGPEGTPPWTAAFRNLLLASAQPRYLDQIAELANAALATAQAEQQTVKLVWHTFERELWRPVDVGSDNARRAWWNDVAPVASGVTQWPFPVNAFGANVLQLFELGFVIDNSAVVTVMAETIVEAAAVVNLDKARIEAAWQGLPFP